MEPRATRMMGQATTDAHETAAQQNLDDAPAWCFSVLSLLQPSQRESYYPLFSWPLSNDFIGQLSILFHFSLAKSQRATGNYVQKEELAFTRKAELGNHWPRVSPLNLSTGWGFKFSIGERLEKGLFWKCFRKKLTFNEMRWFLQW